MERAILVYQGGLANVFEVECWNMANYGRAARRLMQADFHTCEAFARGLAAAGVLITSVHCNQAGDITEAKWNDDLESAPFHESFRPVFNVSVQA